MIIGRVLSSEHCKTCCFSGHYRPVLDITACHVLWRPKRRARLADYWTCLVLRALQDVLFFWPLQAGVWVLLDITECHVSSSSREDLNAVQDLLWLFFCQKLINIRNDCDQVSVMSCLLQTVVVVGVAVAVALAVVGWWPGVTVVRWSRST